MISAYDPVQAGEAFTAVGASTLAKTALTVA
ncbi:hypothetical protein STENM223S_03155 [Streptomyces tendae]